MLASCLANMDKRKKIELDIYEAAEELSEIGAGVTLRPRATEMLTRIGLEADILKLYEGSNGLLSSCWLMSEYSGLHQTSTCIQIQEK